MCVFVCALWMYLVVCVHTVHIQCLRVFTKPICCSLGAHWIKAVALTHSHTYTSTPSIPFSTCFGIFVHTLDLPVQFSFVLGKLTNALLSNCYSVAFYHHIILFIFLSVNFFFLLSTLFHCDISEWCSGRVRAVCFVAFNSDFIETKARRLLQYFVG